MALALIDTDDRITVCDADLGVIGGDPDTSYTLRPIAVEDYRRIVKEHTKPVTNRRTHQKEDRVDGDAVQDAIFDYVLVGWSGIRFRGTDAPCTWDFKKLIDAARRTALLDAAGMNRVVERETDKESSFRGSEDVRAVVDRSRAVDALLSVGQ